MLPQKFSAATTVNASRPPPLRTGLTVELLQPAARSAGSARATIRARLRVRAPSTRRP